MFADDSKCYREITIILQDRKLLQNDLHSLQLWSNTWDFNFNTQECSVMHFSCKKCLVTPHEYYLNQQRIRSTVSQCDLGILVSGDLKWSPRISITWYLKVIECLGSYDTTAFTLPMSTLDGCCTCVLFALIYLMVPKFGRLKHLHLTCIILKVSSVAPPNSFFKTMSRLTRTV